MPNRMEATSRVVTSFWRGLVAAMVASLGLRHCRCELWQHAHAARLSSALYSDHRRSTSVPERFQHTINQLKQWKATE
jgi:hypothetical protein